jgi:hypothetical protein
MNIQSVLAAGRSEIVLLLKSIFRLLQWSVLISIGLLIVFILFPQPGRMPGDIAPGLQISGIQAGVVLIVMFLSSLAISSLVKSRTPGRKAWIGVHSGIVAISTASLFVLPQSCGPVAAAAYALFVFTPNVLGAMALRRVIAGHARAAALCARLICLFHPFRQARFQSSLFSAHALGSIDGKISAYRALALRATADQFAILNCFIPMAEDDWRGVLGQVRNTGNMTPLKRLEIRALGELGQIEEMVTTYAYASAEAVLSSYDLLLCRLYLLAFGGRVDGVQSLLNRQLRFLSWSTKTYWNFIARQAAGTLDGEARNRLVSAAHASDDETFRRTAQRHLDRAPAPGEDQPD